MAEANIESLIRAKGYEDAVVMLGDGSANIVVAPPDGGLQAEDVAVIRDIVISETGMTAGQTKSWKRLNRQRVFLLCFTQTVL